MAPTSFEDLNDDCIRLIVDETAKISASDWRDPLMLKHLSLVSKRVRYLCRPVLFKSNNLSISAHRRVVPTIATFNALAKAEFKVSTLQALNVALNNATGQDLAFCKAFVTTIAMMPSLSELRLDLNDDEDLCSRLRVTSKANNLTLPVKTLTLVQAPNAAFVIQACPHVETFISVANRKWKRTFGPLLTMKTLRRLEINHRENWTVRRLQDLISYMNVPELCLKGEIYKLRPSTLATQLKSLNRLRSLTMTSIQYINHQAFGSYISYGDDEEEDQLYHPFYQPPTVIAQAFFESCPKLLKVRVLQCYCTTKYGCARNEDGGVDKIERLSEKNWRYGFKSAFQTFWPMMEW
ncbi:hypothetical protein H2200_000128 [Cladophialophora chaetospira]|uniref:Uncharacterized protein n=1 Tax=Cladophialophora chaetospira TaxID=386627 RepID=A0AA38XMU4_9EURO|nr:hypothetical protein H2200_000128 [Cladophialophora chaetospira]